MDDETKDALDKVKAAWRRDIKAGQAALDFVENHDITDADWHLVRMVEDVIGDTPTDVVRDYLLVDEHTRMLLIRMLSRVFEKETEPELEEEEEAEDVEWISREVEIEEGWQDITTGSGKIDPAFLTKLRVFSGRTVRAAEVSALAKKHWPDMADSTRSHRVRRHLQEMGVQNRGKARGIEYRFPAKEESVESNHQSRRRWNFPKGWPDKSHLGYDPDLMEQRHGVCPHCGNMNKKHRYRAKGNYLKCESCGKVYRWEP